MAITYKCFKSTPRQQEAVLSQRVYFTAKHSRQRSQLTSLSTARRTGATAHRHPVRYTLTDNAGSMASFSRKTAFLGLFLVICLSLLLCASATSSTANLKAQAKVYNLVAESLTHVLHSTCKRADQGS